MRFYTVLLLFFFTCLTLRSLVAHAQVSGAKVTKEEGPVEIEADQLTYDQENKVYEAHGRVEVEGRLVSQGGSWQTE